MHFCTVACSIIGKFVYTRSTCEFAFYLSPTPRELTIHDKQSQQVAFLGLLTQALSKSEVLSEFSGSLQGRGIYGVFHISSPNLQISEASGLFSTSCKV
eukprot:1778569-Amphidinium_carterae.1